ncbi:MAG: hypothetical protein HOA66_04870 [Candidatus Marinimicrobia bacterium]|nr:hypothetical protein [Candidatus Neomarinimicrobiota bacterium]|tara:strand:- start:2150 stop:2788 length:639 start_codon:yes stop_codon:yes gene_type:complete
MNKKFIIVILMFSMAFSGSRTKSLVFPGWGELSLNESSRGQKLIAADIILWLTVFNGKNLSKNYESDYRAFASEHAGVNWNHTDYLFAVDIGYYDDLNAYNSAKARQRSLELETDLNGGLIREYGHTMYPENGDFDWQWDNDSNRKSYKDMRISSANWDKYANFAIAGLLVNRVISVIDVMYLEKMGSSTPIQSQVIANGSNDLQLKLTFPF